MVRMNVTLALIILTVIFPVVSRAQTHEGSVKIMQPAELDTLLALDKAWHQNNPTWEGYRIQVFFDAGNNSKRKAQDVIENFIAEFPEIEAYLTFNEPYYRVRVGNFHTQLQTAKALKQINRKYPGAFIVKEEINPAIPSFQASKAMEEKIIEGDGVFPEP
ncbi:MAG: SPOR domain-containing protein [Bacteroidia bacterium]|nr:SPOR domain-containing protein [Bacteroidales bacterium]NCD41279.1 SPOR domain-containing protein [Bacteroidia bacterium]HPE87648.1 SPOR domain-containing protein [Bacteroidales bacterium]